MVPVNVPVDICSNLIHASSSKFHVNIKFSDNCSLSNPPREYFPCTTPSLVIVSIVPALKHHSSHFITFLCEKDSQTSAFAVFASTILGPYSFSVWNVVRISEACFLSFIFLNELLKLFFVEFRFLIFTEEGEVCRILAEALLSLWREKIETKRTV